MRKSSGAAGGGKTKWIAIGSVVSAIALFAIFNSVKRANAEKRRDRIVALSSAETPSGDSSDVSLAISFLADPKSSPSIRADASKILERLEGNGISESIHAALKEADTLALKLRLSHALAERNYAPAVTDMIAVFKSATTDEQRVQILQSVRAIATLRDVDGILGALHGDHTLPVRRVFEDTVLAVLRKGGDIDKIVDNILGKVATTSGSERQSLFRILGVLDGEKVEARLSAIYDKGDAEYQRDAMRAFLAWPNRSVLDEVENVITGTSDDLLRSVAERAYVRLATLPGPEPVAELVPLWRKAFEHSKNPNDFRTLVSALVEYPDPETLALVKEWESHPSYGALAKNFSSTLDKTIQGVVELKPGEEIKGNKARIRGDRAASINSFLSSLTGWTSPETYFSWYFKVAEAGDYLVEIDQASQRDDPSQFLVYLGGQTLRGESKRTPTLEEFETIRLEGTVSLQPGTIYSLTLVAGQTIQPRMMDIGAVRLVKP